MKSLKISGEEGIMVGDHMIDIQTGKRVGMKTVGVLTGRTKKEEFEKTGADYVLTSVLEIYKIVEED
jgi:phosphoglycolate phosphatase